MARRIRTPSPSVGCTLPFGTRMPGVAEGLRVGELCGGTTDGPGRLGWDGVEGPAKPMEASLSLGCQRSRDHRADD